MTEFNKNHIKQKSTKVKPKGNNPKQANSRKTNSKILDIKKKQNLFFRAANFFIVAGIWCGLIVAGLLGYLYLTLPSPHDLAEGTERRPSVRMLSAGGNYISSSGDGYGKAVRVENLPSYIPMAFVATEDHRFFDHHGVDFVGLARAVYTNVVAGRVKQGGSTISQQVAKNLFLSNERSFERKIKELVYTIWLEFGFSKKEILALYLNRVYLSNGQYGLSAAANHYFGVPANKLTIWQASVLAGMLKAPNKYNPVLSPKRSAKRARTVLNKMVNAGLLTAEQARKIGKDTIKTVFSKDSIHHAFKGYVHNEIIGILGSVNQDVIVHTTLNLDYQKYAVDAVKKHKKAFQKKGAKEIGLLGMDSNGAIRSMVGGVNFKRSGFNRATQARRQVGSLFKAFVYSKAMEKFDPTSRLVDEKYSVEGYTPRNYDRKYRGVISLEYAFKTSLNIPAVKLAHVVGRKKIISFAYGLGVQSKIQNVPAMALGVSTATLVEMVGAFGAFANKGGRVQPYSIERITDSDGQILYEHETQFTQVLSAQATQKFNQMARGVVRNGTARKSYIKGVDSAGKTGTTQSYRDAWFIGYTNEHVAGIWLGNDDNSVTKKLTGGSYPAIIWKSYMKKVEEKNSSGFLN